MSWNDWLKARELMIVASGRLVLTHPLHPLAMLQMSAYYSHDSAHCFVLLRKFWHGLSLPGHTQLPPSFIPLHSISLYGEAVVYPLSTGIVSFY